MTDSVMIFNLVLSFAVTLWISEHAGVHPLIGGAPVWLLIFGALSAVTRFVIM
jgi:hypothetical protein